MSPIRVFDSHAYPGCPVIIDIDAGEGAAHVEFSDGIVAEACLIRLENGRIRLDIAAYRTGRGSAIAAKAWILELEAGQRWKVRQRGEPA